MASYAHTIVAGALLMTPFYVTATTTTMTTATVQPTKAETTLLNEIAPIQVAQCPVLDNVTSYSPELDLFPIKVYPTEAKSFNVHYYNNVKVVTITEVEGSPFVRQYVLYQRGTPMPTNTTTIYSGKTSFTLEEMSVMENAKYFEIPLTNSVCLDGTQSESYFDMLGLRSTLMGVSSYSVGPCLVQGLEDGMLMGIANYEGSFAPSNCSAVFGSNGYEDSIGVEDNPTGAHYIDFFGDFESDLLARVDWFKFVSYFTNKEAAALSLFNEISEKYNEDKAKAMNASSMPLVAFTQINAPYDPIAQVNLELYEINLIEDAGGKFFFPSGYMSNETSMGYNNLTAFKQILTNVDILVDETYYLNTTDIYKQFLAAYNFTGSDMTTFKFLANEQVYREDKQQYPNGNDGWFESAIPNAAAVLQDVISFTQPQLLQNYTRVWFRNIATGGVSDTKIPACVNYSLPTPPVLEPNTDYSNYNCPAFLTNPSLYYSSGTVGLSVQVTLFVSGFSGLMALLLF